MLVRLVKNQPSKGPEKASRSSIKTLLVVTLVALIAATAWSTGWIPFLPAAHAQGVAKVAVNPSSISSLALVPGTTLTFQVSVIDSQPFSGFQIALLYNHSVLQFQGLDISGGVLGNDAFFSSECVNGTGPYCFPDSRFDGIGVVSVDLFTDSGLNTTASSGKLFSVTFTVANMGFSSIHIVYDVLVALSASAPLGLIFIPAVPYDGYFTNIDCPAGSGTPCKPPTVSFNPPPSPIANQPEFFNAYAVSQNLNGRISQYNWTWTMGLEKRYYNSPAQGSLTPSTNITITFPDPGPWVVTLSVQDNYGARIYYVLTIDVHQIGVSVSIFYTDPDMHPLPSDSDGNPMVNAIITGGILRSMTPGHVLAWVNVTNTSGSSLKSLKLNVTLPLDWAVNPAWLPAKGAIHVYYANTTDLATNPEITQPSTITVSTGNPMLVQVEIPSFNATVMGHPLLTAESILLSVKLSYTLTGTTQSAMSYPRNYSSTASLMVWTGPEFTGNDAAGQGSFFFRVFAESLGRHGIRGVTVV